MFSILVDRTQRRTFAFFAGSLAIIGLFCAGAALLALRDRFVERTAATLRTEARMVARALESVGRPTGEEAAADRRERLTEVARAVASGSESIGAIAILRARPGGWALVAEWARSGEPVASLQTGERDLADRSFDFSRDEAQRLPGTGLFESGQGVVVPLTARPTEGRLVLVARGRPSITDAHAGRFWFSVVSSVLFVSIVAGVTALALTTLLVGPRRLTVRNERGARVQGLRMLALELVFFVIVAGIIWIAVRLTVDELAAQRQLREFLRQEYALVRAEERLGLLAAQTDPPPVAFEGLMQGAVSADWSDVQGALQRAATLRARGDGSWRGAVTEASAALIRRMDVLRGRITDTTRRSESRGRHLQKLLLVLGVLSLSALGIVRVAARQQLDLSRAMEESDRLRAERESLLRALPVGVFTYRNGQVTYANDEWRRQVGPDEADRGSGLPRTIVDEDREELARGLERLLAHHGPNEFEFRVERGGIVRSYRCRGTVTPVPGEDADQILAFSLDITDVLAARRALEESHHELLAKNRLLNAALRDLEENLEAMVAGLVKAVEAKDPYTAGHSNRVMRYSMGIAERMGLHSHQLWVLQSGTLIHDIGKIGVPDAILTKPGALTPEEFAIVREHPQIGYLMVEGIPMFQECAPIVLWHHERLDGSGYPDGLVGDQIPLLVRIAAVADVFDAMTSDRAYRAGLSAERALEELRREVALGRLDGEIVKIFADNIEREGVLRSATKDRAA